MKRISYFMELPKQRIDMVYKRFLIENIGYNESVFKEGISQQVIYLLYKGRCKLQKTVKFASHQGTVTSKKLTVLILEEGDMAGTETLFGAKETRYSLKVDSKNAILFKLDLRYIENEVVNGLRECLKQIHATKEEFLKKLIVRNETNFKNNNVTYLYPRTTKTLDQMKESKVRETEGKINKAIRSVSNAIIKRRNNFDNFNLLQNEQVVSRNSSMTRLAKTATKDIKLNRRSSFAQFEEMENKKGRNRKAALSISASIVDSFILNKNIEREEKKIKVRSPALVAANKSCREWQKTKKSKIFKTRNFSLPMMCLFQQ